ncbi:uncharacterized protein [Dysidea avara]|uniref:uncharacterized protein isoform X2 n=1 Tax=Dysidea avara TaxID=196820 RepID=UPI003329C7D1
MAYLDFQFDPHLPSYIHHTDMQNYLQHYANHFNIMPLIHFSTVVTSITSNCMEYTPPPIGDIQFPVNQDDPPNTGFTFHEWKVTTQNVLTKVTNTEVYDAVMVCNGHHSTPWKHDIAGLENFPPSRIIHSHSYRTPASYHGQTVLVVGAGYSGKDIILDVATVANQVVLSSRKKPVTCPLPDNVKQFVEIEQVQQGGVVLFKDGKTLSPDSIIICNGYNFSFPFLDKTCDLTLDERWMSPLYKHVFNAVHPSMAFIGINLAVVAFPTFDLQCRWVLSVWSGLSKLPSADKMIEACDAERIQQESNGVPKKYAHKLAAKQWDYYYDVATSGGNSTLNYGLRLLYDTGTAYRETNLIDYKNFQHIMTGHSTFLSITDSKTPKDIEAKPKIKIAVIGTGISGLCAVRHCCKFLDCVSVTMYEEGAQIKSWWDHCTVNGGKPSGEYLRTTLPADLAGFQDFAFQPNTDTFPTPAQILKYLQDYCEHYNLLQHVEFNHKVNHVSLKEDGKCLLNQFTAPVEDFKMEKTHLQNKFDLYANTLAYLDDSCGVTTDSKCGIQHLYIHTFNAYHPSMAFLGTLTNISFAYCDMQVMWALRVWLGLQQPPLQSTTEILEECDQTNHSAHCHLDLVHIYNDLAHYSEMQPASPVFSAVMGHVFKSRETDHLQSKNENYNIISQQHWILTNNN